MIRRLRALSFVALTAAAGVVLFSPGDQNAVSSTSEPATAQAASIRPSYIASEAPVTTARTDVVAASTPVEGVKLPAAPTTSADDATPPPVTQTAALDLPEATPPLGSSTLSQGTAARVGGSALNVRAGPSSSTAKLLVLQPGTPVTVTDTTDSWSYVVTADGESGWVFSRYLSSGSAEKPRAQVAAADPQDEPVRASKKDQPRKGFAETGRLANSVTLRAGPSRSAPKLFSLKAGERVAIAETRGPWIRVVMKSGASGWILTKGRGN